MEISQSEREAIQKYFGLFDFEVWAPGEGKDNNNLKPIVVIRVEGKREFCYLDDVLRSYKKEEAHKKQVEKIEKLQKKNPKRKKVVSIDGVPVSFHIEGCQVCEELLALIHLAKDEYHSKLANLRNERNEHMKPDPRQVPEYKGVVDFPKVNLHLSEEDVSVPSSWPNQANRIRTLIAQRKWV